MDRYGEFIRGVERRSPGSSKVDTRPAVLPWSPLGVGPTRLHDDRWREGDILLYLLRPTP